MSDSTPMSHHQRAVEEYLEALLTEPEESQKSSHSLDWKSSPFQAQIISVAGLNLAIPCHYIDAILDERPSDSNRKDFASMPGYLDTIEYQNQSIHRIDMAHIIFPPGFATPSAPGQYTLIIKGYAWGLCCHDIASVITLDPEAVTWRKQAGKRIWLAGTLLEKKLSILDIEGLMTLLDRSGTF